MIIKSIIKNWYRELFWMSVGSVITLAAEKVVRTIKEGRQEREVEDAIQDMAHDISELRSETPAEMEIEEEPEESVEETTKDVPTEDEPIVKVDGLKIISQEEFEDLQNGPDIYNRFELIYDPETCSFGYEEGVVEDSLSDDVDIRNMLKADVEAWIIDQVCKLGGINIYGSLNGGDIYIHVQIGSVEEVK